MKGRNILSYLNFIDYDKETLKWYYEKVLNRNIRKIGKKTLKKQKKNFFQLKGDRVFVPSWINTSLQKSICLNASG